MTTSISTPTPTKIQVFSDIHFELIHDKNDATNLALSLYKGEKYIILAGDISSIMDSNFFDLLQFFSDNWEKVFYIPGNHEFYDINRKSHYHKTLQEYKTQIKQRFNNIYFLQDESADLNDEYVVYGTTLFTNPDCLYGINDAQMINYQETASTINHLTNTSYHKIKPINYSFMKTLADESICKLSEFLDKTTKKVILVTHFPPVQKGTSSPQYKNEHQYIKDYFAWKNIFTQYPTHFTPEKLKKIKMCISGHTHYSYDFIEPVTGIRCLSNQKGYQNEHLDKQTFYPDGTFVLE